ncbi:hypothetical protein BJY00DRAFT_111643 [Aspergillus carlsbadensis]|nr:hypothetical protein BJY00DRAFT_111643 [Aspergillus carlsbadensis]
MSMELQPVFYYGVASGCSDSSNNPRKRSASQAVLRQVKRTCSRSPTKSGQGILNRVHRRVIVRDYGIPIYKAASPLSMLCAIKSCINGEYPASI